MAKTNLYLDTRYHAKDGKGSIIISIVHNRTTTSVSTGIRILPSQWKGGKVVNCSDASLLNADLNSKRAELDKKIQEVLRFNPSASGMTASQLKSEIMGEKRKRRSDRHPVSELFGDYMMGNMTEGSREIYRTTLDKLLDFHPDLCIEDVNYKFLRDFDSYMAVTLSTNSRAIYHRQFRAICNYAVKIGVTTEYAYSRYKIKTEATRKRSIPIEKLREFYSLEVDRYDQRYKDIFFLMFFLIGINAKDLFTAKKTDVKDGRLTYNRAKTHKGYSIKIEPEAQELIDKYAGETYLLNIVETCKSYKNFLHEMNDALKRMGPVVEEEVEDTGNLFEEPQVVKVKKPLVEGLTTYWARHEWATLAYELDIPSQIISQALGHSGGNNVTQIYIKLDPKKVDAANRKVINYLMNKK